MAFFADGDKIIVVDLITMKKIDEIDLEFGGCICHLSMNRSGNEIMAVRYDNTGRVCDLTTKKITTLTGHTSIVRCIIPGDATDIITCSSDRSIRTWDASGVCKKILTGHSDVVNCILYEEKSKRIYSASDDKSIIIWDYVSGNKIGSMVGHTSLVLSLAWVNATTIVSGSTDTTIKVWNITTSTCVNTFKSHTSWVNSVAVTPDGDHVISGSDDKTIKITNITGECVDTLSHHCKYVCKVSISPDGRLIGSSGWDRMFFIHEVSPPFPVLIHDGFLSSATQENKIFRLYSNGVIRVLEGH